MEGDDMDPKTKTCPVTVKAAGTQDGLEEGVVEAIVATYDVDSIGDQIMPGAFAETLNEWKSSGNPIPFVWNHQSDNPESHLGVIEHAEERPGQGLYVKARLDMEEPSARRVYKLLKGRRVAQYSFAYMELDARPPGEKAAPGARQELWRLGLLEAGPTPLGCNTRTSTLDVKSQQAVTVSVDTTHADEALARLEKALDQLDAEYTATEVETKAAPPGFTPKPIVARIRKLVAAAQALLDAVEPKSDSNAEKATPATPADTSASQVAPVAAPEAKAAELALAGTASARLRTDLALMELDVASYTI